MANKVKVMGPQSFAYYHQKLKSYINSLPWGPSNNGMAGLFDIALPNEYDVQSDADVEQEIVNALNLDAFQVNIGASGISWKKPTVVVPEIQWSSTVDEHYNLYATVPIAVAFADGSATQKTITVRKPGPGKLVAIKTTDGGYFNSGLTLDYSYRFKAKGYTQGGNVSVLIGAYSTNSLRTSLRILGGSQKAQSMWPANRECLASTAGMNFSRLFEYDQTASSLVLSQDGKSYTFNTTNTTSGTADIPILIMNEAVNNATYGNGVLYYAEVYDGEGNALRKFLPFELSVGDIVLVDIRDLTSQQIYDIVQNGTGAEFGDRVYYPVTGSFISAT